MLAHRTPGGSCLEDASASAPGAQSFAAAAIVSDWQMVEQDPIGSRAPAWHGGGCTFEQPLDLAVRDSTWIDPVLPPRVSNGAHVRALANPAG